jgi:hypothetical protein
MSLRACRFHNKAGCGAFHYFRTHTRIQLKAQVPTQPTHTPPRR